MHVFLLLFTESPQDEPIFNFPAIIHFAQLKMGSRRPMGWRGILLNDFNFVIFNLGYEGYMAKRIGSSSFKYQDVLRLGLKTTWIGILHQPAFRIEGAIFYIFIKIIYCISIGVGHFMIETL